MSVYPCGACKERSPGKLSALYWAWYLADGTRIAYHQRLDAGCFAVNVAPLLIDVSESPDHCPVCHTSPGDSVDAVFLNVYLPKSPLEEFLFPMCPGCAAKLRLWIEANSALLQDRSTTGGGLEAPHSQTAIDPWADLGVRWRPSAQSPGRA